MKKLFVGILVFLSVILPLNVKGVSRELDDIELVNKNRISDDFINNIFYLLKSSNLDDITYEDASNPMEQYVTKDNKYVRLINNSKVYSYNIDTNDIELLQELPKSTWLSGGATSYYDTRTPKIFVDSTNGYLYYAYNKYYNVYSEDAEIGIVKYNLETNQIIDNYSLSGHLLYSVGADLKGNIFLATKEYYDPNKTYAEPESHKIFVINTSNSVVTSKVITEPINSFVGFLNDGTFYYVSEVMYYSLYGYKNLMGDLRRATFTNNTLTLNNNKLKTVKNIYFADYRNSVEIINNKYLATFVGDIYSLDGITDTSLGNTVLYTSNDLEQGGEYDYIYNAGVNVIINGTTVYALYNNNLILEYNLNTGAKVKRYVAKDKIFNMKEAGERLVLLKTDGSKFYYEVISKSSFEKITTKVINMNKFSVYNRSKTDIVSKYISSVSTDYEAKLFSKNGSVKNPYKEYTLTTKTKNEALKISNYYRWLGGLTGFTKADSEYWTIAGKGAVLLEASDFSHTPAQPSDMPDDFYKEALSGTNNSNIALNWYSNQYKIINTIRDFMNDEGYAIPGHRDTFLTRNGNKIAYGISPYRLLQTVLYVSDPNPSGTAALDNNETAYAWPAPGYFPEEDLTTRAYWTVTINTDKIDLSNVALKVVVEDLDTGKKYVRDSSSNGLYSTIFWGRTIAFAPPEATSYKNKRYKVTLSNMTNTVDGLPAKLEYTVNFFSYNSKFTIDNIIYSVDSYGNVLSKSIKNTSSFEVASTTTTSVKLKWSKNTVADGYEIWYATSKTGKYTKLTTLKNTTLTYTKTGLKAGKTYYFKIRSYKKVDGKTIYSTYKTPIAVSTRLAKPKNLKVTSKGGAVTIKWDKVNYATKYVIAYSDKENGTYKTLSTNKLEYIKKNLAKGKKYYFKVKAYKVLNGKKVYSYYSDKVKIKVK